jgi:hypothetical protein
MEHGGRGGVLRPERHRRDLEQFTVRMSHGPEAENYSLTDALWVPTLIFANSGVLTLAVLLRHRRRTAPPGLALVQGRVQRRAVRRGHLGRGGRLQFLPRVLVAQLDGLARGLDRDALVLRVERLFISFVISLIDGESLPTLLVLPDGLNLLHAAGNLTIGLLAALVWSTGPVGIPLLIAPMVLVFLAYRGWLHAEREEEQAKERERMQTLYEAGGSCPVRSTSATTTSRSWCSSAGCSTPRRSSWSC